MKSRHEIQGEELERRVAILRRFKELLEHQRTKFRSYLDVLERQKLDIERGDVDDLVAHVDMEQAIVSEIYTFQKAIDPLEDLYRAAYPGSEPEEVPELRASLEDLRERVVERNKENRELLKRRMETLRGEVMRAQNPLTRRRSVYADGEGGNLVDLKG